MPRRKRAVDLFAAQKGVCAYCFTEMTLDLGHRNTATIEHCRPKSKGGKTNKFNLIAVCSSCNTKRSNQPLDVFLRDKLVMR